MTPVRLRQRHLIEGKLPVHTTTVLFGAANYFHKPFYDAARSGLSAYSVMLKCL